MKAAFSLILILFFLTPVMANTDLAKQALSQSTTNPFCTSGYDGPNPFTKQGFEKPRNEKSICAGKNVVECYREFYK